MTLLLDAPTTGTVVPGTPLPVVGAGRLVPVAAGTTAYADLDVAASAPALVAVQETVTRAQEWYASVHRGAGFASQVSTELLEQSRERIAAFLGCRPGDEVVLTRNTTDAFSLLAHCLPADVTVVSFASEHHANLLSWRERGDHVLLPVPAGPEEAVLALDAALDALPGRVLVSVTGASNVTGEVWPLAELVRVAQAHGARVAVDAAQLVPHRRFDLAALGADWVAFSGHKLYAPYGSGVLAGRADWLDEAAPYLPGGGAVRSVSTTDQVWATGPARHEGGTPNVLGAVAIAAACRELEAAGRAALEEREQALTALLEEGLRGVEGVTVHRLWPAADRIGVVTFTVAGWTPRALATRLSAEHGVGVRHDRFCAHPLVDRLLDCVPSAPGCADVDAGTAVRASLGVGTTEADVAALVEGVRALVAAGTATPVPAAGDPAGLATAILDGSAA
ncbi:selenocysteine lyase/cysteine desulfurase [Motilibacter rhizosphaerae]|uniref:Selenocysteine lyase/cysteine desulfurase n=1 Tax=Motilibacter rhizosphaerae TaxID=598652 RepID=A0A4Q7NSJ1_9ACTN|nr:aminotransferase class V-fold PLP-dependent enzyme [Motilibacter rhizosphaerae]RZS90103.1 selenocysteine lyase/cysteine desulfurase [Motilibacter rhizosphaerae]